ncbi:DUF2011 domain-containing protein [Aspergillus stella-maris]|uniref:DUF2011 domain-containing protein n=1 Tax=Aspergillus stella-maris TaxID=1810926 RepID=UPI003CCCDBAA
MFDLPESKRYVQPNHNRSGSGSKLTTSSVRRDDLNARTSTSRSPSPAPESFIPDSEAQKRLSALLNLNLDIAPSTTTQEPSEQDKPQDPEDEEQEFEFRLFSAPTSKPSTSTKPTSDGPQQITANNGKENEVSTGAQKLRIRLRSPTPIPLGSGEGRFLKPSRGWSYYFSTPGLEKGDKSEDTLDEALLAKRKEFEDVAVSGADMLGFAGVNWPGCHLPWRVTYLKREHVKLPKGEKLSSTSTDLKTTYINPANPPERTPLSRKKPGKKRRIQLRKKTAVADRAKETEAEKRNRKNRERKMKRRQKAREIKAAMEAAGGGGDAAAMDVDGGASGSESD